MLESLIGKPFGAAPDACYPLCQHIYEQFGVSLPDIDQIPPEDIEKHFLTLDYAPPWSVLIFGQEGHKRPHAGIILPDLAGGARLDNSIRKDRAFIHAMSERVRTDRLDEQPWRNRKASHLWPRGVVSIAWMHSPVAMHDASWFLLPITGRSLALLAAACFDVLGLPQDKMPVQIFYNRQPLTPEQWSIIPTETDRITIRPTTGSDSGWGIAAMVGLMALGWWAGAALFPTTVGGAALEGAALKTAMFYQGVTSLVVVGGGGLVVSSLIGANKSNLNSAANSPEYSWNPITTQRPDEPLPDAYGKVKVYGNIVAGWTEYSTDTLVDVTEGPSNTMFGVDVVSPGTQKNTINMAIALGEGPFHRIDPAVDTEVLNEIPAKSYADVTITHRMGTHDQTAVFSSVYHEAGYDKELELDAAEPVEVECPDVNMTNLRIVIRAPSGLYRLSKTTGNTRVGRTGLRICIKEDEGDYQPLYWGPIAAKQTGITHWVFDASKQYYLWRWIGDGHKACDYTPTEPTTGKAIGPVTITPGHTYTVKVENVSMVPHMNGDLSEPSPDTANADNVERNPTTGDSYCPLQLHTIAEYYPYAMQMPGTALTYIQALAQEDLNGSVAYETEIEGKIVEVYDSTLGQWIPKYTENGAWIARDVLCKPLWVGHECEIESITIPASGPLVVTTTADHEWLTGWTVNMTDIEGISDVDGTYTITVTGDDTFTLDGTDGAEFSGTFTSGFCNNLEVEEYRGSSPDIFELSDLQTLSIWCKEQVDDGAGGTEDRFVFSGLFSARDDAWTQHLKVLNVCRASCYWSGAKLRIVIDRPVLVPSNMFTLSNMENAGFEDVREPDEDRATEITIEYCNGDSGFSTQSVSYADANALVKTSSKLDYKIGCRRQREALRMAYWRVLQNSHVDHTYSVPLMLDGRYEAPNSVPYLQHDTIQNGTAGSIMATTVSPATATVSISVPVSADPQYMLVRTWSSEVRYLDGPYLITAISTDRKTVTISGSWTHRPEKDDIVSIGEWSAIQQRMRITRLDADDVFSLRLTAAEYNPDAYDDAELIRRTPLLIPAKTRKGTSVLKVTSSHTMTKAIAKADTVSTAADVTKDAAAGFVETFDDSRGIDDVWEIYAGSTEAALVAAGLSGSNVLQIGDNSGEDYQFRTYHSSFPFDPSVLYCLKGRVRCPAGTGKVYLGLGGRNAADDAWVNINGADALTDQHWVLAANVTPGASWVEYVAYVKGTAETGSAVPSTDPDNPAHLHEDVRYVRPIMIVNLT
jgi:hypothetical protein